MSTLKSINVIHPSGTVNNIVNDASGNVTVGNDLYVTTGNVGIGTISPSTKTVINLTGGTSSYTNPLRLINVAGGASGCEIQFAGTYSATAPDNTFTAGSIGGLTTSGSSNGSGALIFKTQLNGTLSEAMRIDSSGSVGIGCTPNQPLTIVANTSSGAIAMRGRAADGLSAILFDSNAGGAASYPYITGTGSATGDLSFGTAGSVRMRIDYTGSTIIGENNPGNSLRYVDIYNTNTGSSAGSIIRLITSNAAASGLTTVDLVKYKTGGFYINNNDTDAATFTAFNVGASEAMRIHSSGNLLVGTTSIVQNGTLSVVGAVIAGSFTNSYSSAGGACLDVTRTSATGDMMYFHTSSAANLAGYITCPTSSTTSYVSVSDYRLKENVTLIATGLKKILALKPVTYDWINDKLQGEGFIAHEVQAVIPLAVVGEKDAVNKDGSIKPQGIDPAKIVVHLVAAIQELEARLAKLETVQ